MIVHEKRLINLYSEMLIYHIILYRIYHHIRGEVH